jgi:hypothetical protein
VCIKFCKTGEKGNQNLPTNENNIWAPTIRQAWIQWFHCFKEEWMPNKWQASWMHFNHLQGKVISPWRWRQQNPLKCIIQHHYVVSQATGQWLESSLPWKIKSHNEFERCLQHWQEWWNKWSLLWRDKILAILTSTVSGLIYTIRRQKKSKL